MAAIYEKKKDSDFNFETYLILIKIVFHLSIASELIDMYMIC